LLQKRDNFQKRVETYGPPYFTTRNSQNLPEKRNSYTL